MLETVDAILRDTPEVLTFSRRTGAELGFFLTATNRGDYSVRLRSGRRRPIEDVIREVRHADRNRVPPWWVREEQECRMPSVLVWAIWRERPSSK